MQLEARLAKLERSLARTRLMNLALLLGLGLVVAGGAQSSSDEITTTRLTIVDEMGKERVVLSADQGGAAGMWVFDSEEKLRSVSGVAANNATISQWLDPQEHVRLSATCSPSGECSMQWRDAEDNLRIGGATLANGDATMMWIAPGNKPQIRVLTDKTGTAKFLSGD